MDSETRSAAPGPLPLLGQTTRERSDAARNREALLDAATALVARDGVDAVSMDAVAREAGVGKGTVFRRFESRAGLMAALLDRVEADWQGRVMHGPPPLGPGAPALERLLAFGRSRAEANLLHADLLIAAQAAWSRSYAAYSFTAMHVRYLLGELGAPGSHDVLATMLVAPLEPAILRQQTVGEQIPLDRVLEEWERVARAAVAHCAAVTRESRVSP